MRKMYWLTSLALLFRLSTITAGEPVSLKTGSPENPVSITIIYDNYQQNTSLEADWGFACLVEYSGHKLLFDAGRDAELYKMNVGLLEIDPREIPALFISHEHGDHTAGLPWIIKVNPSIKCYLPSNYADQLKANNNLPRNSIAVDEPFHLDGPYYSTGDNFNSYKEQGLIIKTENGGVLITGCGHPGAVEMIEVAKKKLGIDIHTLIGGLHLMRSSEDDVLNIASTLKEMGIRQLCPTHCTGDQSISTFKSSFGDNFISGGTGKKIIIE